MNRILTILGTSIMFLLCLLINKEILQAWVVDYIPFYGTLLCIPFFIIMAECLVRLYDALFPEVKP